MTTIPAQRGAWKTAQNGDLFGDAVITKNIHFDNEGYVTLGRKPMWLYSETDDSDFGTVQAIVANTTNYLVVTNEGYFTFLPTTTGFTVAQTTTTSQPGIGDGSDGVTCFGRRYVSGTTTVKYYDGAAWQTGVGSLTSTNPHPLCEFENKNRLAIADGNTVTLYDSSHSANSDVLTIPSSYTIVWMRWKDNNLYIGTKNTGGGSAKMFRWNGTGTEAQAGYTVNAKWIYSGADYDSSICVVTSAGQLLRFNGGGFDPLANFPVYYTNLEWIPDNYATGTTVGRVNQRGMVASGDILYINIDGSANTVSAVEPPGELLINQPSGIWVFDPKIGLYHKAGYANSKYATISVSSLSSNTLTMASAHGALTGDACIITNAGSLTDGTSAIGGGRVFFVIKISATELKLALTRKDAEDGNVFNLSGSAGVATLTFDTYDSFGSTFETAAGAIALVQNGLTPSTFFASEIFFGGRVTLADGTSSKDTLQSLGMGRSVGHIVFPKTLTDKPTDAYQNIIAKVQGLDTSRDKIIIKARTKLIGGLPTQLKYSGSGLAGWTDGTEFAIDSRYKSFHQAKDAMEVEVVLGAGAGQTAHLDGDPEYSSPSYSYVCHLDETLVGIDMGDKSEVIVDNWKKVGTITSTSEDIEKSSVTKALNSITASSWVQFKVELRGFDVRFESGIINSRTHKS